MSHIHKYMLKFVDERHVPIVKKLLDEFYPTIKTQNE